MLKLKVLIQFVSLNHKQIISNLSRYDIKNHEKATVIDIILSNSPHLYHSSVFCSDISDLPGSVLNANPKNLELSGIPTGLGQL